MEDTHSGRAEAFGILAALTFLRYYLSCYAPVPDTAIVQCFCDNMGVITNIESSQTTTIVRPNDTTANDRDLIMAIAATIQQCQPLQLQFLYVKGHQDTKANRPLTLAEHYNVECDRLAKEYVCSSMTLSTSMPNPEFEAGQPHLSIASKIICHNTLRALHENAAMPAYHNYLCTKNNWTPSAAKTINWDPFHQAIHALRPADQRRIVLFVNNKLPFRTSKSHPHPGSTLCPSCQWEPEDLRHFLACEHIDRRRLFEKLHRDLTDVASKYHLHPGLLRHCGWVY